MAFFVARVELRGKPGTADYDKLHMLMQKEFGFTEGIHEQNGLHKEFRSLPHATYAGEAEGNAEQLRLKMEERIVVVLLYKSIIFVAPIPAGSSTTPS